MRKLSPFAEHLLSRDTAYIARWHHRPVVWRESLAEHHGLVARITYELALTLNLYFPEYDVDAGSVTAAALYHDEGETVVGDMPSPAKRLFPDGLVTKIEHQAIDGLWGQYPAELRGALVMDATGKGLNTIESQIVRYADTLSAYSFARDQVAMGNGKMADVVDHIAGAHVEGEHTFINYNWPWLAALRKAFDLP